MSADLEPVPIGEALRARFDAVAKPYPPEARPSLVLPLLHCMQQEKGYLTDADATAIAGYIGVPAIQVVEALHWYTMFNKAPVGRHVLKVCRNIACALRGSEQLIDHLQSRLGIASGETTADGRYTLIAVECLASCGTAPAMQINETYHENLDVDAVDRILKDLP